jgi:hypothetical protein
MHKYWPTFSVTAISSLHNLQEWRWRFFMLFDTLHFEAGPHAIGEILGGTQ